MNTCFNGMTAVSSLILGYAGFQLADLYGTYIDCKTVEKNNRFCAKVFSDPNFPKDGGIEEKFRQLEICQTFTESPVAKLTCDKYQLHYQNYVLVATISSLALAFFMIFKCYYFRRNKVKILSNCQHKNLIKNREKQDTEIRTPDLATISPLNERLSNSTPATSSSTEDEKISKEWEKIKNYVVKDKIGKPTKRHN